MRSISTRYKGYNFRSRLEARWAVFFDILGLKFSYEKEGFEFNDGEKYLPDFYIPDLDYFIEIKGDTPSDKEMDKASKLAVESGKNVFIFFGDIPYPTEPFGDLNSESALYFSPCGGGDIHYQFCECSECGKIDIQYDGRSARINCGCHKNTLSDKMYNANSKKLMDAYLGARSVRFEFMEELRNESL